MCNNNNNDACLKIAEILAIINVLQKNACSGDTCLDTCDRGFLGCGANTFSCNTRPIMLYLNSGAALTLPTTKDSTVICDGVSAECSNVFRVEKVDGCSCTLRVLAPNTDPAAEFPYVATNSFCTVNLNCVCVLRCLSDTYVECL